MRTSKIKFVGVIAIVALMIGATARAQTSNDLPLNYKTKSSGNATKYSVMGMLIPITAGIAWWQFDKPKRVTVGDSYYGNWTYTEDPDRTIPVMLVISGIIVGPSAGYFYGGCPGKGIRGIAVRFGTGAFALLTAGVMGNACDSDEYMDYSGLAAAATVAAVGSAVVLVEAIVDVANVKGAVEENNPWQSYQKRAYATLVPKYYADSGLAGLELNITF